MLVEMRKQIKPGSYHRSLTIEITEIFDNFRRRGYILQTEIRNF